MNVKTIRNIQVQGIHFVGVKRIQPMRKVCIGFMKEIDTYCDFGFSIDDGLPEKT